MMNRHEYIGGMATTLRQWSVQLGELRTRQQDGEAEVKALVETAVLALRVQQKAYQEQMRLVKEASEETMADMRLGAERIAQDFSEDFAQADRRFSA